jgi:hypothetical protein
MAKQNKESENGEQSSTIPAIEYAIKVVREIYIIEKNIFVIFGVLATIFVILVINIFTIRSLVLISDNLTNIMILLSSIISTSALIFMLLLFIKSRKQLEDWANILEQNAIKANINIAMANKSKEEVVKAIAETIDQIGEPLRKYISSKENFKEFLDVAVDKDIVFDILIDADRIQTATTATTLSTNSINKNELKNILKTYGSVMVKIVDGIVDQETVQSFSTLPSKYASITKNKVGLALIIGEKVTPMAYNYVRQNRNSNLRSIMLIEKHV